MSAPPSVPVLRVVGPAGAGKTLLITSLIEGLREHGRRVTAVERREDGSAVVTLAGGARVAAPPGAARDLHTFAASLDPGADLVVVEGDEPAGTPALELVEDAASPRLDGRERVATVDAPALRRRYAEGGPSGAATAEARAVEQWLRGRTPVLVASEHRRAIFAIQAVHTAIFFVVSGCIFHVLWAGLRGRGSRLTAVALSVVGAEIVALLVNEMRCPLTSMAEELGAEDGRVSDILLPRWFADRIPQLCTPPLLVGVAGLLWHRRRRPRQRAVRMRLGR